MLASAPAQTSAGESTHAKAAIEAIGTIRPDAVFLDVHMPEIDGFAVVPHLDPVSPPLLLFVTAFERHALQAFEAQAFDYLLKPFTDERFADVVRRLRGRLREREQARTSPPPARTLLVRDGTRTIVVPHDDIVWIEAEDYCARIHLRDRTVLVRESLRSLVTELSGAGFVRVHRSAIARLAAIRAVGASELRRPAPDADQRNNAASQSNLSHSTRDSAVWTQLTLTPTRPTRRLFLGRRGFRVGKDFPDRTLSSIQAFLRDAPVLADFSQHPTKAKMPSRPHPVADAGGGPPNLLPLRVLRTRKSKACSRLRDQRCLSELNLGAIRNCRNGKRSPRHVNFLL